MKKFVIYFRGIEFFGVLADTKEKARKKAIDTFNSFLKNDLFVLEMKARTERRDICQYTYIPSEMVLGSSRHICVYCYADKYESEELNLSDIDIPF